MREQVVIIDYVNWRGERALRRIKPERIFFGSNEWHQTPQWLLKARDIEKQSERTFAMSGIIAWEPAGERSAPEGSGKAPSG